MIEETHPSEFETASVMQRAVAHFIDSAVVCCVVAVFVVTLADSDSVLGILLLIAGLAIFLGYRIFGDSMFQGRALGKRLVGIRVVDAIRHKPCTHLQSLVRNGILFIPFMPLIELVLLCIDGQDRWGDRLAKTYVLRDRALTPPSHGPGRPLKLEGLEETLRHRPHHDDPA